MTSEMNWGLTTDIYGSYMDANEVEDLDEQFNFVTDDLDPLRQEINDIILPGAAKIAGLTEGEQILADYKAENPDATLEDFLKDESVSDEDKQKVLLALAIEQNPNASPEEIDKLANTLWQDLSGDYTLSEASYQNLGLGEKGGEIGLETIENKFGETSATINKTTFNEQTMLKIQEYQILLQALADMFIKCNQIIGQTFQKACQ